MAPSASEPSGKRTKTDKFQQEPKAKLGENPKQSRQQIRSEFPEVTCWELATCPPLMIGYACEHVETLMPKPPRFDMICQKCAKKNSPEVKDEASSGKVTSSSSGDEIP